MEVCNWQNEAREQCRLPREHSTEPRRWNARGKVNSVLETVTSSKSRLAEYCRRRDPHPDETGRGRTACEGAGHVANAREHEHLESVKTEKSRSREIKQGIGVAETAALLTVRKKSMRSPEPICAHDQKPPIANRL